MFGRLSHSVADRTASLRDVPATAAALGADAADSVRRAITWRRLAWVAALVLAFAVPFAVQSLGGESPPAAAEVSEPAAGGGSRA